MSAYKKKYKVEGRCVPFAESALINTSNGLTYVVFIPEIILSSLGNPSKFIAYKAFPIHLFSWNHGIPLYV